MRKTVKHVNRRRGRRKYRQKERENHETEKQEAHGADIKKGRD